MMIKMGGKDMSILPEWMRNIGGGYGNLQQLSDPTPSIVAQQHLTHAMQQASMSQMLYPSGTQQALNQTGPAPLSPTEMLKARLTDGQWTGWPPGFSFMYAHPVWPEGGGRCNKVIVFAVTSAGSGVTLEDDMGLFPSDTLITQLRML